uniref:Uncharacterized protein n=2 Tax=Anguilla anguilla TaxID=7936 RepID=A0A0E9STT2_ANGAN
MSIRTCNIFQQTIPSHTVDEMRHSHNPAYLKQIVCIIHQATSRIVLLC